MPKVDQVRWQEFSLNDKAVFSLISTTNGIDKNKIIISEEGKHPYITRTEFRNGLDMFIGKQEKPLNNGNVISIGLDTQTVFYQQAPFYTGQNIQILSIMNMTPNVALFILPLIKKQLETLNWGGNGATLGRLKKKRVLLPIQENGQINFDFMKQYIQMKRTQIKNTIRLPQKHEKVMKPKGLNEIQWCEFKIVKIAKVVSGADWQSYKRVAGNAPFIGASAVGNGVTDFINYTGKESKISSGVIGVNRNGSVGYAFYHPYTAYFSGDTRFIELIGYKGNRFVNQFVLTSLMKQREKYAYGYKMGTKRIQNQSIMLPVNQAGEADYHFMEQYMRYQENKVLHQVKDFMRAFASL